MLARQGHHSGAQRRLRLLVCTHFPGSAVGRVDGGEPNAPGSVNVVGMPRFWCSRGEAGWPPVVLVLRSGVVLLFGAGVGGGVRGGGSAHFFSTWQVLAL
jgi:hypothetical protein